MQDNQISPPILATPRRIFPSRSFSPPTYFPTTNCFVQQSYTQGTAGVRISPTAWNSFGHTGL